MATIEYPVNVDALRQEIATVTAGYEIRNGGIFYGKKVPAGFAIAATMMDGQTMEHAANSLPRPTLDTEVLVVPRLLNGVRGIITGFLDKLVVPEGVRYPKDIVAHCIATELSEEAGQSPESLGEMPLLRGGRYSYTESGGRKMHIITGAWITPNGKPEIVGDGVEIGESSYWTSIGSLATDAARHPENYTTDFAATTLPALLAGYPDLLQNL